MKRIFQSIVTKKSLFSLDPEAILNCLDKEKGHKTEVGGKIKHWAKNNFRKTTESLTGMYTVL